MIDVVAALIERTEGGRTACLIAQRAGTIERASLWEFPGGKVEPGESHGTAIEREVAEELGTDAQAGELFLVTVHTYPDRTIRLWTYRTVLGSVATLSSSHSSLVWAPVEDLERYAFSDADLPVVQALRISHRIWLPYEKKSQ